MQLLPLFAIASALAGTVAAQLFDGTQSPDAVIADLRNKINVVQRESRRTIEQEVATTGDRIVAYNDLLGCGTPRFERLASAQHVWIGGLLASFESHQVRVLNELYAVATSARGQLGGTAYKTEVAKQISLRYVAQIDDIAATTRQALELVLQRSLAGQRALNAKARRSGQPLRFQVHSNRQMEQLRAQIGETVLPQLDEEKNVLDSALQQLADLL